MKKVAKIRAEARFKRNSELAEAEEAYASLNRRLAAMSPLQARKAFAASHVPRFVYKYRGVPIGADAEAVDRLRDLVVRNRLWMADVRTMNDPFDSYVDYRITLRGADLRKALERFFRRTTDTVSFKADLLVNTDLVVNPRKVEQLLRTAREQHVAQFGVCSLSSDARSKLLWAHYANEHRGVAIQLEPALDPRQLLPFRMNYEEAHRIVVDELGGGDRESVINEFLIKDVDWAYEKEWRLIERGNSNVVRQFRAAALTGIIFGLRAGADEEAVVDQLLDERRRANLSMPRVYRIANRGARLKVVRR